MTNELLARIEILEKENKKLQKKLKDKQEALNAIVEYIQMKHNYSKRHIFNVIEQYKNKQ